MKRAVPIVVVFAMLVMGTELRQFLRLPFLVEHFIEHCSADADLDMAAFLWMHYCTDLVHDKDLGDDEKLPFRSHDNVPNLLVIIDVLPGTQAACTSPRLSQLVTFPLSDPAVLAGQRALVWQPPRA